MVAKTTNRLKEGGKLDTENIFKNFYTSRKKKFYTQRKKKKKKKTQRKKITFYFPRLGTRERTLKRRIQVFSLFREKTRKSKSSPSLLSFQKEDSESPNHQGRWLESESSGQMARCSSLFSFQREDSVIQLYSLITERRLGSSKSSLFSERRLAIRRFHSKSYLFSEERLGEKTPTSKPFQKTFQSAEEVRVLVCWCVGVWVGGVVGSGLGGFRNGTYTQEKSLKA